MRVTANDARSFVLDYRARADRRQRRFTIGNIETWSAASARERARKLKREVDAGNDPLGELEQERAAPTINELADRYVAEHLPRKRPRSRIEDERLLPIIRAALGREKVAAVTYTHIDRLHRTVTEERGPFRANRVLALLSKMFSLAIKWRMRPDNPVVGVERNPEPKRERFLSQPELDRLLDALVAEEDAQAADVIRLLLLTGARICRSPRGRVGSDRSRRRSLDQAAHDDQAGRRAPPAAVGRGGGAAGVHTGDGARQGALCLPRRHAV